MNYTEVYLNELQKNANLGALVRNPATMTLLKRLGLLGAAGTATAGATSAMSKPVGKGQPPLPVSDMFKDVGSAFSMKTPGLPAPESPDFSKL